MAWYDTGTVSVTNGSTTVTGAGTNFVAGVQIGEGFSGPDGRIYEIQAVVSATALTLADPYLSSTQTGQDYKIVPTQSLVANLASQVSTLISDFQGVVDEAGAGKFDDGTAASAGITFLQDQDTGFFRPAANQIGFTTAGVQRALLTSTGLNSTVIGATTPAAGTFTTIAGTADASIRGLTVGRGAGGIGTNAAVGIAALQSNTTGTNNTANGYQALQSNISASNNTAQGYRALQANTTGTTNTAGGASALTSNTEGGSNTAYGFAALTSNTTGNLNTAVGRDALRFNTTGNENTAQGYQALYSNLTGATNTAHGNQALRANTTGNSNTAVGRQALFSNTAGTNNTAVGREALQSNTTGSNNTAQGYAALQSNTTGVNNTAQGYQALQSNTEGTNNTAVGRDALNSNTTGTSNTAHGFRALQLNTTGIHNTAVGYEALNGNTEGVSNTAVGIQALKDVTTGGGNLGLAVRTAGATYSPVFNPTTHNNRIVMGHTGVTNAYVQVAWTVVSDARDKAAFAPVPHGLDFVNSLKPTEYQFKENGRDGEADGIKRYGFLAQDVLEIEGDNPVIVDTEDLDKLKLKESNLIPVLVNAIQELTAEVQTLKAKLEAK